MWATTSESFNWEAEDRLGIAVCRLDDRNMEKEQNDRCQSYSVCHHI